MAWTESPISNNLQQLARISPLQARCAHTDCRLHYGSQFATFSFGKKLQALNAERLQSVSRKTFFPSHLSNKGSETNASRACGENKRAQLSVNPVQLAAVSVRPHANTRQCCSSLGQYNVRISRGSRERKGCKAGGSVPGSTAEEGPSTDSEGKESNVVLLKEWKVTIDALAAGEQIFILRKGGIHERAFTPPTSEFLFFPGFFHATPSMLKPDFLQKHSTVLEAPQERQPGDIVELNTLASCTGFWTTKDPGILSRLKDLHIWTDEFLDKRLAWKADRPLTILELLVEPLVQPVRFEYAKEHGGCKSWVSLPSRSLSGPVVTSEPSLSLTDFASAQLRLRERLRGADVYNHFKARLD